MQAGFKLWFEPSLKVFHPELRELPRIRKINYPYSVGQGYLLRKYHCPLTPSAGGDRSRLCRRTG